MSFRNLALLGAFLGVFASQAAAQVAISALPSASAPLSGAELLPLVQGGVTKKTPSSALGANIVSSLNYAKGNGVTDDTAALNSLFAYAASAQKCAYLYAGTYKITAALAPLIGSGVCILGDGANAVISYQGASATPGDLLTIGDGVTTYVQANLSGFRITSTTSLSAGAAIRLKKQSYLNVDVIFDGKAVGSGNLYDGLWADTSSIIDLHDSRFYVKHDAVIGTSGVEMHLNHALIEGLGTGNGVHLAGGYGGLYTESLTEIGYNIGLLVDTSAVAVGNLEIFVSPFTTFDTNTSWAAYFNDNYTGGAGKVIYADGWFASSGSGGGLALVKWNSGSLNSSSGVFINNGDAGLYIGDISVRVVLGTAVDITANGNYGVRATAPVTIYSMALPHANTGGSFDVNTSIASGSGYFFTGNGSLVAPSDGVFEALNAAGTSFGRLQLGGTTASFPALKRSAATLQSRLADDSAFADFYAGNVSADTAKGFYITSRGSLSAASDGVWSFYNNAGSDFGRLQFGGTSASFPALKRNATGLDVRLADDSAAAPLTALTFNKLTLTAPAASATLTLANTSSLITVGAYAVTLTASNTTNSTLPAGSHSLAPLDSPTFTAPTLGIAVATSLLTTPVAVGSLAPCDAGHDGNRDFVTDATATTFASAVAGMGANHVPVYCDGGATAWKIG